MHWGLRSSRLQQRHGSRLVSMAAAAAATRERQHAAVPRGASLLTALHMLFQLDRDVPGPTRSRMREIMR